MKAEEYNLLSNFSEIAMRRLEEREFKRIKVAAPPAAPAQTLITKPYMSPNPKFLQYSLCHPWLCMDRISARPTASFPI